ncbi:MAG: hypothetical protein IPI16_05585 [Comamonadaceae bacterium]|nr:hypothetical protein [Comamonadaceae bacterium]
MEKGIWLWGACTGGFLTCRPPCHDDDWKSVPKSSSIEGLTQSNCWNKKNSKLPYAFISLSVAGLWFVVAAKLTSRLVARLVKPASRGTSCSSAFVGDVRTGNDAYAGALAEIEEGRLDKGAWARAFADAGGDEPKEGPLHQGPCWCVGKC